MSFITDLTDIMNQLQDLLRRAGPVTELTVRTYKAHGAKKGVMTVLSVPGITSKDIKNSSTHVVESELRKQISRKAKSLADSEAAKRKTAEGLVVEADEKRAERDKLKLLDPPPLVSLALEAPDDCIF